MGFFKKVIPSTFSNNLDINQSSSLLKYLRVAYKHLKNPHLVLHGDILAKDEMLLRRKNKHFIFA